MNNPITNDYLKKAGIPPGSETKIMMFILYTFLHDKFAFFGFFFLEDCNPNLRQLFN
jgi:hypothetical protein